MDARDYSALEARKEGPVPMADQGRYDGVIFDMDGTLIEPLIDFQALRRELHIPPDDGILEHLAKQAGESRRQAMEHLEARELDAANHARPMSGAKETLHAVVAAGLKRALLTRNTRQAVEVVFRRLPWMRFDLVLSREDGPIKPQPEGVLRACRQMGIRPERCLCVGDFRYDIQAANAAGACSVLLASTDEPPDWAGEADYTIRHLGELTGLLEI